MAGGCVLRINRILDSVHKDRGRVKDVGRAACWSVGSWKRKCTVRVVLQVHTSQCSFAFRSPAFALLRSVLLIVAMLCVKFLFVSAERRNGTVNAMQRC